MTREALDNLDDVIHDALLVAYDAISQAIDEGRAQIALDAVKVAHDRIHAASLRLREENT